MARAHFVKKALKDNAVCKKGESYWWWQFRHGPKQLSKERPKPQQLTQSEFYQRMYDIQDMLNAIGANDEMPDAVQSVVDELRSVAEECEEKRSNMPDSLQDAPSGEMLQERADNCTNAADELENIDFDDAPTGDPEPCEHCNGDGKVAEDCTECENGRVPGIDGAPDEECKTCSGTAQVEVECSECGGSGEVEPEESADTYWENKLEEVQGVSIDF